MNRHKLRSLVLVAGAGLALGAGSAEATNIQDLVRIKGHERNTLVGLGIVVGLNGTGDQSKDSLVAARPYEQLLTNLGNPIGSIEELGRADAYAIVQVSMEIPATGTRSGDRLDVSVSALFNAESLEGGELVMSPLRIPVPGAVDRSPLAFANGPLLIEGTNPRRGTVRGGGQMIADIRTNPVTPAGTMTLVLKDQYAGYPVATTIAEAINDEFVLDGYGELAVVDDAKNVTISVPSTARARPAGFIASLLLIPVDPSLLRTEARIVINERRGIIVVTGDVQIGPVLITHGDLTITSITPLPAGTAFDPLVNTQRWAEMDTTRGDRGASTALTDLLRAFDQLNVSVADQIAIVHELTKTGRLHAEIVLQ